MQQMGVHEEELVWLAARVRQIRADFHPGAATANTLTYAESPEDALMQEYHRRSHSAATSGASNDIVRDQSQQNSSDADTSTRLNAERDLQFVVAQGSSASLWSTAGQEQDAPT